jgi:hypothetical protein
LHRSKRNYLGPPPQNPNNMRETKRGLVYQFPSLQICRDHFAKLFNEEIAWNEENEDWSAAEVMNENPFPGVSVRFAQAKEE